MSYFGIMLLNVLTIGNIPEVEIQDKGIIAALNVYIDSMESTNEKPIIAYQLLARLEKSSSGQVLYLNATCSMFDFTRGLPDKYSKIGSHLVFWFERRNKIDSSQATEVFLKQFEKYLINDITPDGKHDFIGTLNMDAYLSFQSLPIRFVIERNQIKDIREVCLFPNTWFYQYGYKFDKNGDLMFDDGAYDPCSIDGHIDYVSGGQDVNEYITSKAQIPENCMGFITAEITINKNGSPIKVTIKTYKGRVLDNQSRIRLEETILNMPPWSQESVKGKIVSYRVSLGF